MDGRESDPPKTIHPTFGLGFVFPLGLQAILSRPRSDRAGDEPASAVAGDF